MPIAAPAIPPIKPLLIWEDEAEKVWSDRLVSPGVVPLASPDIDVDMGGLPKYKLEEG